jgi:hypothetical protein
VKRAELSKERKEYLEDKINKLETDGKEKYI